MEQWLANTWQMTVNENVLDSVVEALLCDPSRKFVFVEQAFFQRWWSVQNEVVQSELRKLVDAGQFEFINGGWCMHDEAASHYINMIDQTTLGHLLIKNQFNKVPRAGWQIDPFEHSAVQAYLLGVEGRWIIRGAARADACYVFRDCTTCSTIRDRPNEGSLSIFTEFSLMADPSFDIGHPGESAVELGRIIDRGLRESRAVDTESLCVLAGKLAWSVRVDLHILDNGGNLVDASNIAALTALLTFRRPECSLEGENGQEVVMHPPEVREPLSLMVHHLPIAVTFAFIGNENIVVIDPTHNEEAVMGGRMTVTLNATGDVCAIQKAGGVGILQSVVMQCLRIASVKAGDITSKIKSAVESYNTERALRKIKRHTSTSKTGENQNLFVEQKEASLDMERLKLVSDETGVTRSNTVQSENQSSQTDGTSRKHSMAKQFTGGPSSWDPYSKGIDAESLKVSLASRGTSTPSKKEKESRSQETSADGKSEGLIADNSKSNSLPIKVSVVGPQTTSGEKTLQDAVKPKNKRKKRKPSPSDAS